MAAHRFWRILPTFLHSPGYTTAIASILMRETPTGPNLSVTGSGAASALSEQDSTHSPSKAFLGIDTLPPIYEGWRSNSSGAMAWIMWDFGASAAYDIRHLTMWAGQGYPLPATFKLQWSDDSAAWADLVTWTTKNTLNTRFTYFHDPITATASISPPSPLLTFNLGAVIQVIPPKPIVSAHSGANVSAIAPSPVVQAAAGTHLTITAPSPTIQFTAHDSTGENAITAHAPSPTLSFYTGAVIKARAPSPTLSITGTTTSWVKAAVKPPKPIVSATATVSGMVSAAIRAPSPNLVGYGGAVCSVTLTGRPTVQATAATGAVASIAVTCPLFQVKASATAQNYGSLHVIAPSPRMGASAQAWLIAPSAQLTAIGSAVVTATYEAYAINLGHRNPEATTNEVTRYTNFPFTHVVRYQNSYYGASSTGLYLLEGTTDDATPIPWSFKTGITDFDDAKQKTVAAAYFGGSMPPATTVTLFEGDKVGVPYAQTTPRGADLQNYRETFARGVKGRYYALGLSGTGNIELDDLDFEIKQLTRRI